MSYRVSTRMVKPFKRIVLILSGGFGAHPGHDAHMLYTISAVQILALVDALDTMNTEGVVKCIFPSMLQSLLKLILTDIAGLQVRETGAFAGDEWGAMDTRFVYGAFNALSILGRMEAIDVEKSVAYIAACQNYDGGFGLAPGAESHSGQIFTCVAALHIAKRLDLVNIDLLGWWLCERQLPNGGLNGRPEKLEDVCYSWWVLSSLAMIDRLHWIDRDKLTSFILSAQDTENGGIADRPGHNVDIWHTHFGLAGLSVLGYDKLEPVNPAYCLPTKVTDRLKL